MPAVIERRRPNMQPAFEVVDLGMLHPVLIPDIARSLAHLILVGSSKAGFFADIYEATAGLSEVMEVYDTECFPDVCQQLIGEDTFQGRLHSGKRYETTLEYGGLVMEEVIIRQSSMNHPVINHFAHNMGGQFIYSEPKPYLL